MITLYGIKNCDTVKRARDTLDQAGIAYRFHDFKSEGLSAELAQKWIATLGLDLVLNRRGTTWRKLDEATQQRLNAGDADVLSAHTSVVKRPVIDRDGALRIGFARDEADALVAWLRA